MLIGELLLHLLDINFGMPIPTVDSKKKTASKNQGEVAQTLLLSLSVWKKVAS